MTLGIGKRYLLAMRAIAASEGITALYGDTWSEDPTREWDCSLYVWQVIRRLLGIPAIAAHTGSEITTQGLHSRCTILPPCFSSYLTLLFVHDTTNPFSHQAETSHVSVLIAPDSRLPMHHGPVGSRIRDVLVLDMDATAPTHGWQVHSPERWISSVSWDDIWLSNVIPGEPPADYHGVRFALSLGYLALRPLAREPSLRT